VAHFYEGLRPCTEQHDELDLCQLPERGPISHFALAKSASVSGARWYIYLVRVKTSITLPKELLGRLDRVDKNRSALLERAALAYLDRVDRQMRDRRDAAIIDRNAGRLNREARDTLGYQKLP
jgi:hypothetical protein